MLLLEPRVFGDSRGFFFESWNQERYQMAGIGTSFVQDSVSYYKVAAAYRPDCEVSLAWDDPDIGIAWPGDDPVLSAKDGAGIRLRDIPQDRQPVVGA